MALLINSPYAIDGQVIQDCGIGLCDPTLRGNVLAMTAFIYDTSFLVWDLVGNADAGNITIDAGQVINFFDTTDGEPVDGGWQLKTKAFTNSLRESGLVKKGLMLVAFGLMVEVHNPVQRGGTGASAADPMLRSAWLQNSASGPNYSAELQAATINYLTFRIEVVDGGNFYDLGPAGFSPAFSGPSGQATTRNGSLNCVQFAAFPIAFCIGDADSGNDVDFTATFGAEYEIQSSTPATVAGSEDDTEGTINTANQGDVYVPVRVVVVGTPVCYPLANLCGNPIAGLDGAQLAALAARGIVVPGR